MSLPKRIGHIGDHYEKRMINVFDIATKIIVFTGDQNDVSIFVGCTMRTVRSYIKSKCRCKKKYAIRYAKNNI